MVVFRSESVGAKQVKEIVSVLTKEGIRRAILVNGGKMTSFAKQAIEEVSSAVRFETFREEELRVDITEHELVPEHRVLRPEEKAALLERYKLHETKLPRIQASDPVARFYGMQRGEVVKIIRPSQTAGRYVTYRIVM